MCALTLKHDRRQRLEQQQEMRAADELQGQLRAAAKMCQVKGRVPIDVIGLSPDQEIALLEEYALRLELEARDFLEAWPGQDGRYAARWFRMERSSVLQQIVKLTISSAKGEQR